MTKPEDIFSTSFIQPKFNHATHPTDPLSRFTVYPISGLPTLIQTIQEKSASRLIRYVLDCSGKLWFAEGGYANQSIPMHFQMTGDLTTGSSCMAAGYLELSKNYQEITMINHDSSFRTTMDSIKWPLIILATLLPQINMSLSSNLRVEQLSPNGAPIDLHILDRANIETWVHSNDGINKIENMADQPSDIRTVSYPVPHDQNLFFSLLSKEKPSDSASDTYGIKP